MDKGTQFKIYLPRVWGVEDSISSREGPVSLPQGTETILLAEDEPSLRQLMARVLRTQGYTVLEAADGHEALTLAQANGAKIQLLLTDVIMPGLSGKTLAEWLGQVNPAGPGPFHFRLHQQQRGPGRHVETRDVLSAKTF